MMKSTNITNTILSLIWGLYLSLIFIIILYERYVFNYYFKDINDYLILFIFTICAIFIAEIIIKFLASYWIHTILFSLLISVSIYWLILVYYLPIEAVNLGCIGIICSQPSHILLISLSIGLIIPLLINEMVFCALNADNKEKILQLVIIFQSNPIGILTFAFSIICYGLFSYITYYTVFFSGFISQLIILALFFMYMTLSKRNNQQEISSKSLRKEIQKESDEIQNENTIHIIRDKGNKESSNKKENPLKPFEFDIGRLISDIFLIGIIGVFTFSTIKTENYNFGVLVPIGFGILLYFIIYQLVSILNISILDIKLNINEVCEFLIYFSIIVAASSMDWIFQEDILLYMQRFLDSSIPLIISGTYVGYMFYRIEDRVWEEEDLEQGIKSKKIKHISDETAKIWMVIIWIFLFFIISMIRIIPDTPDGVILYPIAMFVGIIGFIIWWIRLSLRIKFKSN